MRRKKHAEHVNHERWLVSYADFITLLFAFFVVLFASGQSDKAKQKKVSAAIASAFSQMAIFEPHSATPAVTDASGAGSEASLSGVELPMATARTGEGAQHDSKDLPSADITPEMLRERVEKIIRKQVAAGTLHWNDVALTPTAEGLVLSLREGGFFGVGSAELRAEAVPLLEGIAEELPPTPVRVEGHTDNLPEHSALYASNWELSSARASAITRFLLEHSRADPAQLSVAGYAEFHPVASNATEEGRARNRRVDIVFLKQTDVRGEMRDAKGSRILNPAPSSWLRP